jgi:DNA/RNA-binding domain of Phe-tRNA-synthetase-like protein
VPLASNLSPLALDFVITDDVRRLGVRGAYAVLSGLDNRTRHPGLQIWRDSLVQRLAAELHPGFIEADPVLAGFRRLHDSVKRSNKRFVSSAEALVALFQRKGVVPQINPLVDIYNAISLETRFSLGAHDVARVNGRITLCLTRGGERFVPLGATGPESIQPGEYCYLDDSGEVLCRLEHRQCERTKVTAETTQCFYIIQGNPATPRAQLEAALASLVERTVEFCGGRVERSWMVG